MRSSPAEARIVKKSKSDPDARRRGDSHLLRGQPRPPRRVAARRPGRGGRPPRAERRRQDHADPQHHGVHAASRRPNRARGRADRRRGPPTASRGAAWRWCRRAAASSRPSRCGRTSGSAPGRRRATTGRSTASSSSSPASGSARARRAARSRAASSRCSRSGARCSPTAGSCSSTSRRKGSLPLIVHEIGRILGRLKTERLSILLVEQNYHLALAIADRVYVMSKGQIVWEGTPAALESSEDIKHRYLGVA